MAGGLDSGGFGLTQGRRFSSQPIGISGRRILTAAASAALPTAAKIVSGSLPTGYVDHGSIVQGLVNITVTINVDSIDLGRIPSPHRFYITGQKGNITANLQEYQPEMIDLAAGGDGSPATGSGYTEVYIGGVLGDERRILVLDDFDVDFASNGFNWAQFWWTQERAQAGGTFTLGEEKAQTVVPIDYNLLTTDVSGINRLLYFRAINHS